MQLLVPLPVLATTPALPVRVVRCGSGGGSVVKEAILAVKDSLALFFQVGARNESLEPRTTTWKTTVQLAALGAAVWIPFYIATEILYHFLDPTNPPSSVENAIQTGVAVLTVTALLEMFVVLPLVISRTFDIVAATTATSLCSATETTFAATAAITLRQCRRIGVCLLLLLLGCFLLVSSLVCIAIFMDHSKALQLGTTVAVLACTYIVATTTCLTIPAIVRHDCTIWSGIRHSMASTCQSPRGFILPLVSFAVLNAAWMGPVVAFYWPPPLVLALLTWMATSWNMILWTVLWERLAVERTTPCDSMPDFHLPQLNGNLRYYRYGIVAIMAVLALQQCRTASLSGTRSSIRQMPPQQQSSHSKEVWYTRGRRDQSGAQCLEMLLHHAYAHHYGVTFGGACVMGDSGSTGTGQNYTQTQRTAQTLIANLKPLAVDQFLKFGCPPTAETETPDNDAAMIWGPLPWFVSRQIITADWLAHVQSQLLYPAKTKNDVFRIVVQIRRGDVTPCSGDTVHRYLPNSYYLDMIDKYSARARSNQTIEVIIHSSGASLESMDVFRDKNYTLKLHKTPLEDVWTDLMTADVSILSPSGFSIVPALLNHGGGIVVYAPYFFFGKAPGWESIGARDLQRYRHEVRQQLVPMCQGKTRRYRLEKSGVVYLLKNFGFKGLAAFFNPR